MIKFDAFLDVCNYCELLNRITYLRGDKMPSYINMKNEIAILQERQKQIIEELNYIENILPTKIESLKIIDTNLKELQGIENKLYYNIIVTGLSPTKAVQKVSFDFDKDESTIWKNYYPKVKEKINVLANIK